MAPGAAWREGEVGGAWGEDSAGSVKGLNGREVGLDGCVARTIVLTGVMCGDLLDEVVMMCVTIVLSDHGVMCGVVMCMCVTTMDTCVYLLAEVVVVMCVTMMPEVQSCADPVVLGPEAPDTPNNQTPNASWP